MNYMSASQCSSGCESGWTFYLDQSSFSKKQYQDFGGFVDGNDYPSAENDGDDEEEDLSMVSDASSGPPHYCEDDEDYCFDQSASRKRNKNCKRSNDYSRNQKQRYYLDDTASSPVLNKKTAGRINEASHVLEFSQGFSATDFKEGKSSLKKHFSVFQSEKSASKGSGGFQGIKWK